MAEQNNLQVFLKAGPFGGLNSRTATVYAPPQTALSCSNADTHRLTGALSPFLGREQLADLSILGPGKEIASIGVYIVSSERVGYVAGAADGTTAIWDSQSGYAQSLSGVSSYWSQGVQSNGVLWLNNGQQVFYGSDDFYHTALWQYPAPDKLAFDYSVGTGTGVQGSLAQGIYYYAFVQVVTLPYNGGDVLQRTTPTGALTPYDFVFGAPGTVEAFVGAVTDPSSVFVLEPAIYPGISNGATVTVTSTGTGTFNVYDTLGTFLYGIPAGQTVNIAGSSFVLTTAPDLPSGEQSSYSVVPDSLTNASIVDIVDPQSILNGTPTTNPNAAQADNITITSTGTNFNVTDSLGNSQPGVAAGSTVTMGAATFTLSVSVPSSGDMATFTVLPMEASLAFIGVINDPHGIFGTSPSIDPNVSNATTVTIQSNGGGTFSLTDTLGNSSTVDTGTYVFIDGSFFAITALPVASGKKATYQINPQVSGPSARINGVFSGTTPDGYPFVTEVYRMSSNVPIWYLLTTLKTNGEYFDSASDESITSNAQLDLNRDQPLCTPSAPWPVAAHQDRMWAYGIVNNANTGGISQTQLMYSQVGQPWSFDLVNQTMLIEDDQTAMLPSVYGGPREDQVPVGAVSIGSALLLFKSGETGVVYGTDQLTYQPLKLLPDIGCIAPRSIVNANGVVFWLSAQGVYSYDGSSPQYVSDDLYNELAAVPPSEQALAASAYADLTYFLSFGSTTYAYYIPNKTWTKLPYGFVAAVSRTNAPSSPSGANKWNEVAVASPSSQSVDALLQGDLFDLGDPIPVEWTTQVSDSQTPETQKDYMFVALSAAPTTQPVLVTVTLSVDPASPTAPPPQSFVFDLSDGPWTHIGRIAQGSSRGYTCQLALSFSGPAGIPVTIYSLSVAGYPARSWVISDNG